MKRIRSAGCIAVGSELLGGTRLDTNSLKITRSLARFGIEIREKRVVGDDEGAVAGAIAECLEKLDLVVVTGGLGPTADDVTRGAVARALGRTLQFDPGIERWIRDRYRRLGLEMPDTCRRMAWTLPGARMLQNTRGTAPGMLVEIEDRLLAVFPGVPWEMELMLARDLEPELERRNPEELRLTRTVVLSGVVESEIESRIRPLYEQFGRENITILASPGVVRLLLTAGGSRGEAEERLERMVAALRPVLGADLAGIDAGDLHEIVLDGLRERGWTLATAESCTGGLVGKLLTDVPGSSDVYLGGVIAYSNRAKVRHLGIDPAMLEAEGAVSEPVARAMAEGVRERFGADWGIGITGIAGPSGGTPEKPVGLVHWALAGPQGVHHRQWVFPGDRGLVRTWSAHAALDLLRRKALGGSS